MTCQYSAFHMSLHGNCSHILRSDQWAVASESMGGGLTSRQGLVKAWGEGGREGGGEGRR